MQTSKLSLVQILAINAYWFGHAFMWNGLHVLILPAVLLGMVSPGLKNTSLGLLTFAGLCIAMLVQPLAGGRSDAWVSPWGRRRPLILAGVAGSLLFLGLMGWAGGLTGLVIGYLGLQVCSNVAQGAMQGLLPDMASLEQMGRASAIKNVLDMAGLIAASLLIGRLLGSEPRGAGGITVLLIVVLALATSITLLSAREKPSRPPADQAAEAGGTARRETVSAASPASFSRQVRASLQGFSRTLQGKSYQWLILSRFLFLAGIYGIQSFAQYYIRDVLAVPDPLRLTGDLLATLALALLVFAASGGWLGDRLGHKRMLVLASVLGALGCLLLPAARTPAALLAFGGVLGMGIGLFLTANWALANALAPAAQAGMYLGLVNLATAGAGAFARLEGPLIDYFNQARPGLWLGYSLLFLFGMLLILLSGLALGRVRLPAVTQPEVAAHPESI